MNRNLKYRLQRLLAGVCAAAGLCAMPMIPAGAAVVQEPIGYRGDLDSDGVISVADVNFLADYLESADTALISAEQAQFADMDADGLINVVDLTLLKRTALGLIEPEMLYLETENDPEPDDPIEDESLIDAPVNVLSPKLSSTGTNRLLMFVVDFPDCKFTQAYSPEEIKQISFGPADASSENYPLESVIGYYERASYGALEMEADVYAYTAQNNVSRYADHYNNLVEEVMAAFDAELDYSAYDVNADGQMDTILISVADNASDNDFWPCSGDYSGRKRFDGVRPGNMIIGNADPSDTQIYNNTWIHELGHAMGLPDYYKYEVPMNAAGEPLESLYGMNGDAGWEMMDDAYGDMCAFSKLMYGWYTPSQVQMYTGGTQTFTLQSSQQTGSCLIIPRGDLNGYLSEYMILEFAEHKGNNSTWWLFQSGGIRVLHCEATVGEGNWGPEFSWENYGLNYDSSNTKRRVLRLVNEDEGGGFFTSGSTVDESISGFRWYDDNGDLTVSTGVSITVGKLENGAYTVTVSELV